ncbi:MAG: peptidoglycan-binding protein [Candidatus Omnitrophica bacterium]|nr:peptidoglycan-binding protein [Candidatus Omnitrophota bacterium]
MKKKLSFLLVLNLFFYVFSPVPVAEAYISLTAPSAVLLEPASEKILYSRAPHRRQQPASTTKLVTALVILDSLPLDHWVTISSRVQSVEASKLYLRSGDRLRVRDLLKAILMKSANDAAMAAAIEISGTERAFGALMTQKARSFGAKNTRFVNASGLPAKGQYTTAYDLALMMRQAMKNETIVSILRQKGASIKTYYGYRYHFKSHNKMLLRGERVIGKTGYTRLAKYCFVGLIEEGSRDTIVSVLGSRKLWLDLRALVVQLTGRSRNFLSYGDRGKDVKDLQAALKKAGYFNGPITGYFGKQTRAAVLKLQKAARLTRDGVAGPRTKELLKPYL